MFSHPYMFILKVPATNSVRITGNYVSRSRNIVSVCTHSHEDNFGCVQEAQDKMRKVAGEINTSFQKEVTINICC